MSYNYYKVLYINQKASDQEIRQAYKKMALKFHPDKNSNAGYEERFKLIGEAYCELKDPIKRAKFDKELKFCRSQCSKCSAIFVKSADLTKHCEKYHPGQFKCIFCTSIACFETSKDLIKHVSKFHQFKCDMCQTSFGKFEDLTQHKFNLHSVPVVCTFCQSKFTQLEELTKHAERCPQFNCNLCPTLSFKSSEDLTQHNKASHRMPFKCTYCDTSFAKYADVKQHISTTHGFKCNSCPAQFEDLSLLSQHKKQYHPAIFTCNYCVNHFSSLNDLNNHVKSHHIWKCDLCSAGFKKKVLLTRHKEQFHPERFQCKHCTLTFVRLEGLNQHVKGDHNFKCGLCPALFKARALLTQHEQKCLQKCHHKNKCHSLPFECSFCKTKFGQVEELTKHAKLCSQFKCNLCPTSIFKSFHALTQHIKAKKHFRCDYCVCVNRFSSLDELNNHVKSVHSFICDICSSLFTNIDLLTLHKEKNHSANFGCNYCVNRFSSLDDLNNHVKSIHRIICDLCPADPAGPALFMNIELLTQHKEKYHPAIILCSYCVNRFASLNELDIHIKTFHHFECDFCPAHFRARALLTQHEEKCHPLKVDCAFCRKAFANSEALNQHISNCHDFKCTMCPRRCVDMNLLTQHIVKCHPTTLECNLCDHKFVKLGDKSLHMSSSHNFECDFCPSSFVRLAECWAHMKQCQPITYNCTFCTHSFPNSKGFYNHKRKNHPMPFKCTFCTEKFVYKEDVNRHMSSVHEFKCEKCKSWFFIPQPGPSMNYVRKPISLGNAPLLCNKETCFLSCK